MSDTIPSVQEQQSQIFGHILQFYDLADDIVNVVGRKEVTNRVLQLEIVAPFVKQLQDSADIISSFYTEVMQNRREVTPELQDKFETAFRNIFYAYKDFLDRVEERLLP